MNCSGNISSFCTCKNLACPLHPTRHDKGCAPCISKNLRLKEIPGCFFNTIDGAEKRTGDSYEDFSKCVSERRNQAVRLIRPYQPSDCKDLAKIFYNTVHTINAADYTAEQLAAWATGEVDLAAWNQSFLAHHTVVAVEDGFLVGFGDMDAAGYLDRLYVHKDYQRRGIATAICDTLEYAVSADRITTYASITAKPFFQQRGYQVTGEHQADRNGVTLKNYAMEKLKDR